MAEDTMSNNAGFMVNITKHQYTFLTKCYIEVVVNYNKVIFVNNNQILELADASAKEAMKGTEIYFGPAVRKYDNRDRTGSKGIFLAGCFWVNIDSPKKGLNFEQRQNEAVILLEGFKRSLQNYDVSPSYVVSTGYEYTVYLCAGEPYMEHFSEWKKIQTAFTRMAKVGRSAEKITGFVRMPGTFNYEDRDNPKKVEIIHHGHCIPFPKINLDFEIKDKYDDWYYDQLIYDAMDLHKDQVVQVLQRISEDYS